MPKDTKTLGNNKARACESLGFAHKKRLCLRFDTTSYFMYESYIFYFRKSLIRIPHCSEFSGKESRRGYLSYL